MKKRSSRSLDLTRRTSGVLLHPSSLPSDFGIGNIGSVASLWLRWLAGTGSQIWQILPLGPTGYGDSPYQSFSSFAGNPQLIDPKEWLELGLLEPEDLAPLRRLRKTRVEFGRLIRLKQVLFLKAYERFNRHSSPAQKRAFTRFKKENAGWLDDYALFMAIKEHYKGKPWHRWQPGLSSREPQDLKQAKEGLQSSLDRHKFLQFFFFKQWHALRSEAARLGISILGDMPIFAAHDSADVWANQTLFRLNRNGLPQVISGVPPDYFSPNGQLWGNPHYRWRAHKKEGYRWWIERVRSGLGMLDFIRLDHFRGFEAAWEVPARSRTARKGRWVKGPGNELFDTLKASLGPLPLVAEDLGVITAKVDKIRKDQGFPGMKVLQFGFEGGWQDDALPHRLERDTVVYTGTHDNDTTQGWYRKARRSQREFARNYLNARSQDIAEAMTRTAWSSVADTAIAPMQDLLHLGSSARMNRPGTASGNWTWRLRANQLTASAWAMLREYNQLYDRA